MFSTACTACAYAASMVLTGNSMGSSEIWVLPMLLLVLTLCNGWNIAKNNGLLHFLVINRHSDAELIL